MKRSSYINQVLSYIDCNAKTRKRLREDLSLSIQNRQDGDEQTDLIDLMGSPKEKALEIIDDHDLRMSIGYEYISPLTLFGLPLIHVNLKRKGFAKGIIAIGTKSIGFFSAGAVSLGLFSMGAISLGLLISIGSLSLAGIMSLGAVAVSGFLSLGAVAVAPFAVGAVAIGRVAIGDVAYGILAIMKTSGSGRYEFFIGELPAIKEALKEHVSIQLIRDLLYDLIRVM